MSESYFQSPEDNDDYIPYSTLKKNHSSYGRIAYRKLLYTKEWDKKRKQILERDKYTCQSCEKKKPHRFDKKSLLGLFRPKTETIEWSVVDSNRVIAEELSEGKYWLVDKEKFNNLNTYSGFKYVKASVGGVLIDANSFKLHVHHKIYILNILPWENFEKDLITLCNKCHRRVHSKEVIKSYYRLGNTLELIDNEDCQRCDGGGYIPKYDHVENGICFKCYGGLYEQFSISIKDQMFREHYSKMST